MASSPSAQNAKKSPVPVNIFIAAIFPARWRAQTVARSFLRGRGGGGGAGTAWNESRRHSEPHAVLHKEHDGARPALSGLDAAVYCCGTRWMQCCSHHLLWYRRRRGDGSRPTLWGGGRGSDVVALSPLQVAAGWRGQGGARLCCGGVVICDAWAVTFLWFGKHAKTQLRRRESSITPQVHVFKSIRLIIPPTPRETNRVFSFIWGFYCGFYDSDNSFQVIRWLQA